MFTGRSMHARKLSKNKLYNHGKVTSWKRRKQKERIKLWQVKERKKEIVVKWTDEKAPENCRNPVALLRLISVCKSVNNDDIRECMDQYNSWLM